jgi:demethylmenaquinone methyltransferase/2-methoxy-6-polyprenyl-1,4-benzoquinol methylase
MTSSNRATGDSWSHGLRRVARSRDDARRAYDRASRWYGLLEEPLERRPRRIGLRLLATRSGEHVLDVGCGPGATLVELGRAVGPAGRVAGVDLSPAMISRAACRARRAGLADRVDARVADAAALPWPEGSFDAVFASFTLELFDTPEIPAILGEWRRVLRPGGRLVVVALSRSDPVRWPTRAYERLHDRFPAALDCRPIHAARALEAGGFDVVRHIPVPLFGLRADAVLGARP